MEPKKISFGFSKIQKKVDLVQNTSQKVENKVELIKCLEGQSIKLVDEQSKNEELLVIPLKEATRTAASVASLIARHNVLNNIQQDLETQTNNCETKTIETTLDNETIEQKAARELLEAINKSNENETDPQSNVVIPKPDELPLDGAKESSMDDYESIPIAQFGFAMLRGMGWKDVPKEKQDKNDTMEPLIRPKGMGLGADKIAKPKPLLVPPDFNETLEIKKNAFVRILAGKHKDLYAQIEGFDDHAGRVIVKLAIGGNFESLNEFMVQPISKKEYAQYSKVINSAKYEEYKKLENSHGQIILKQPKEEKMENFNNREDRKPATKYENKSPDSANSNQNLSKIKIEENDSNKSDRYKQDRDRKPHEQYADRRRSRSRETNRKQQHRHEERRKSRSSDSSSQSSDYDRRVSKKKSSKSKKHKNRNRHRHDSSDDEKRHKKKTKKSKRPRSRSRDRRS